MKADTQTNDTVMSNETATCTIQLYTRSSFAYFNVALNVFLICECFVVIFIIWWTKKLHGNTNILVASLALNDLMAAVFYIFMWIITIHIRPSALLELKLANIVIYGLCTGITNQSMIHMAAIAVDRYIHIVHPFYYMKTVTKNHIYIALAVVWINGIAVVIIPTVVFYKNMEDTCIILHQPAAYFSVGAAVCAIAIVVVCFCYSKIACIAFKHKKAANVRRTQTCEVMPDIRLRDNRKAAMRSVRFVALMFGVFTVCIMPPVVTTGMSYLIPVPENIYVGFSFLIPIHSVIGFLIYATMNRDFLSALVETARKDNCLNSDQSCCKLLQR